MMKWNVGFSAHSQIDDYGALSGIFVFSTGLWGSFGAEKFIKELKPRVRVLHNSHSPKDSNLRRRLFLSIIIIIIIL